MKNKKQKTGLNLDEKKLSNEELKNMSKEKDYKDVKPKNKALKIFTNVLFGIVMVILVVFLGYSLGTIKQNKVPSFFGQSYVKILTGSMKNSGFNQGDIVMIKKVNISEIKIGDVVAFYYEPTTKPTTSSDVIKTDYKTGGKSFSTKIVFHQVSDIVIDGEGELWFETFGTSNTSLDEDGKPLSTDGWTKGDHVVGSYQKSFFAGVLKVISSEAGIICLVILPCCILLFTYLLNIIDIIDKMLQEKKKKKMELETALAVDTNNKQQNGKGNINEQSNNINLDSFINENISKDKKKPKKEKKEAPKKPTTDAITEQKNHDEFMKEIENISFKQPLNESKNIQKPAQTLETVKNKEIKEEKTPDIKIVPTQLSGDEANDILSEVDSLIAKAKRIKTINKDDKD